MLLLRPQPQRGLRAVLRVEPIGQTFTLLGRLDLADTQSIQVLPVVDGVVDVRTYFVPDLI